MNILYTQLTAIGDRIPVANLPTDVITVLCRIKLSPTHAKKNIEIKM